MIGTVKTCRLGHALRAARLVRPELQILARQHGLDLRRLFADYWRRSAESWVWLINGKMAAVGGWIGPTLGRNAEVWVTVLPLAQRHWREFVRLMLAGIERLVESGKRLVAHVEEADAVAVRFARFCGFRPLGEPCGGVLTMVR